MSKKFTTSEELEDFKFALCRAIQSAVQPLVEKHGGVAIATGNQIGVFVPAPDYVKELVPDRKWMHFYINVDWVHVLHDDLPNELEEEKK